MILSALCHWPTVMSLALVRFSPPVQQQRASLDITPVAAIEHQRRPPLLDGSGVGGGGVVGVSAELQRCLYLIEIPSSRCDIEHCPRHRRRSSDAFPFVGACDDFRQEQMIAHFDATVSPGHVLLVNSWRVDKVYRASRSRNNYERADEQVSAEQNSQAPATRSELGGEPKK